MAENLASFALEQFIEANRRKRSALVKALARYQEYFANNSTLPQIAQALGISREPATARNVLEKLVDEAKQEPVASHAHPATQTPASSESVSAGDSTVQEGSTQSVAIPDPVMDELRLLVQQLLDMRDVLAHALQRGLQASDLSGCFLVEANLEGVALARVRLKGTYLQGADLSKAILYFGDDVESLTLGESYYAGAILELPPKMKDKLVSSLEEQFSKIIPPPTAEPLSSEGVVKKEEMKELRELSDPTQPSRTIGSKFRSLQEQFRRPPMPSHRLLQLSRSIGELDLNEQEKEPLFILLERIAQRWDEPSHTEAVINDLAELYEQVTNLYKRGRIQRVDWLRIRRYYYGLVQDLARRFGEGGGYDE